MSWYRDDDGKIITDEEFQDDCCNCSAFCYEGMLTVPCNGEKTDCPYFKEVDTSDYDKEIRNKAIDEFAEKLATDVESFEGMINGIRADLLTLDYFSEFVFEIAEQMKGK